MKSWTWTRIGQPPHRRGALVPALICSLLLLGLPPGVEAMRQTGALSAHPSASHSLQRSYGNSVAGVRRATTPATTGRRIASDIRPYDGGSTFVVTTTADSGAGSLRQAISDANASSGADTIDFAIPGSGTQIITPTSALPAITDTVTISGTSQTGATPGTPLIEINGSSAGASADGLTLQASGSTIEGLSIVGFAGTGVVLSGTVASTDTVQGNYIGLTPTGAVAANGYGVMVQGGAVNNTIGGAGAALRNVISGNSSTGLVLNGAGTSDNLVQGNYIGTNVTGTAPLGNGIAGVTVEGNASNNTIGGTSAGTGNLISGNGGVGLYIIFSASSNVVEGNYIGTNATGTSSLSNANAGVVVGGSSISNTIGGTSAGARNLISGNTAGSAYGVEVTDSGTSDNMVEGNFIGTDVSGTVALGNGIGVLVQNGATNNTIGGTAAGAGNLISGNSVGNGYGVEIRNSGTSGNLVLGNLIGTNSTGTAALDNSTGVNIQSGASGNTVGGTAAGARNIISGNLNFGVDLDGTGTSGNLVQGNFVGTNATGTAALGNADGVVIASGASNNTIGGTSAGAGNLISGNGSYGVYAFNTGTSDNVVEGNFIGTDVTGTAALSNTSDGVVVGSGASSNTIGGTGPGAGNIIAYNGSAGVGVGFFPTDIATGNAILGNSIHDNADLGIEFGGNPTPATNATPISNTPNLSQPYPILSSVTTDEVGAITATGTLTGAASTDYRVELFGNTACDPSGFGEGQTFLGAITVTTNISGSVAFAAPVTATVPVSDSITSTAIDPSGNTSEFSHCIASTLFVPTPTPTATAVATSTATATATATNTPAPTATSTLTATATNTPAPTATHTPAPTATNTPAPTGTPTSTPAPTNTRVPIVLPAPTSTPTALPLLPRLYFAGGQTSSAHPASLGLLNPNSVPAHVSLAFDAADGTAYHATLTLPARSAQSLPVTSLVALRGAFGLVISADQPVAAQLIQPRPGQDDDALIGSPAPGRQWYLAEGYTGLTFHETITLFNPDPSQAVTVTLRLLPRGGGRDARTVRVVVPAHAETSVDVNRELPRQPVAVSATATGAVVLARTQTFGPGGYGLTTVTGASAAATQWLFAEGTTTNRFQTFLTVFNPGSATAHLRLAFYDASGKVLANRTLSAEPESRVTLRYNDFLRASAIAAAVTSDRPIVVERPEYFGSPNAARIPGADVFGAVQARPRWGFAGGESSGKSEYLLIFNPGKKTVPVQVTVAQASGAARSVTITVPPKGRATLEVGKVFPGLSSVRGEAVTATDGQGIVAERTVFAPDHSTLRASQGLAY